MTLADVVSVTAYLADMADFPRFNEIYREYFTSTPSANAVHRCRERSSPAEPDSS